MARYTITATYQDAHASVTTQHDTPLGDAMSRLYARVRGLKSQPTLHTEHFTPASGHPRNGTWWVYSATSVQGDTATSLGPRVIMHVQEIAP